jgi:DNA repair protein RadD
MVLRGWRQLLPTMERGKVSLRDYQIKAIEQLDKAQRALFVLPTGGGKTVIAAGLIDQAVARNERVLVLTHRREILTQTSRALATVDHGVIQAGLALDLGPPVQVASVQTLHARAMRRNKIPLPSADLVIIDEAHHVRARTWSGILAQYPRARIIGLTATPCRGDGRGLGNTFDELIEGPQVAELIAQGYLVKTRYFAPSTPSLKGVETRKGDYVVSQLSRRMNTDELVGDVVTQWIKHAEDRKTIAFAVDVEHSIHIRDEFCKAGIVAEHIDGSTPKIERDAILDRLRSGETCVVSNCMVLTEGFDCPDVGCIVLARPTRQLGLYRQMAGRGLRPAMGKNDLIMLDHSGAVSLMASSKTRSSGRWKPISGRPIQRTKAGVRDPAPGCWSAAPAGQSAPPASPALNAASFLSGGAKESSSTTKICKKSASLSRKFRLKKSNVGIAN